VGKIQVLSQNTINQIAAGEVIERPASVVKELVENAIDAKASAVTVEIKEGGIDFIRITDNGSGIEKDEVKTAFLRHATSKIRTTEDLLTVGSLGFRGEALASIASIAKVEVITKTAEPMTGVRYMIEGGEETAFEEVGCPEGTTFLIRSLFYNTPARRKFLKSKMTEASYISTMLERIALSHPEVSLKLINQGKTVLHTTGSGRTKDVIYQIYGKDIAMNLLPVEVQRDAFSIEGYIGKPVISRGNRNLENYFVNGRYIKNTVITRAIEDGYKTWQMVHKYPFTALNLQIEPEFLDVNVHPAKMEVRFKNGEEIFSAFLEGIRESLGQSQLIPKVSLSPEKKKKESHGTARGAEPFEEKRMAKRPVRPMEDMLKEESRYEVDRLFEKETPPVVSKPQSPVEPKTEMKQEPPVEPKPEVKPEPPMESKPEVKPELSVEQLSFLAEDIHTKDTRQDFHIIGQLFDTYWLLQRGEELLFMDQHAAHEKVLYEKLMKSYWEQVIYKQQLMPPVILSLTMKEQDFVKTYDELLSDFGFTLEEFGPDAYCLRTVPSNLFGMDAQVFFRELLDGMEEEVKKTDLDMVLDRIATMACKAAIKANHKMTVKEAEELLLECEKLENPYTCPHGRPILFSMSKKEIEKKFKRIN
jgi:DNA mismatch repair protein MutL